MQAGFNEEDYEDIEKVTKCVTDLYPELVLDECDKSIKTRFTFGATKAVNTKAIRLTFKPSVNTELMWSVPEMIKAKDTIRAIIPKDYVSSVITTEDTITVYFLKKELLPYGEYVE